MVVGAEPHGEFALKRRFENFSDFAMAVFPMTMVLPRGMVVHSIGQLIPGFNRKINQRPPYANSELDNRSQVNIFVTGLAPGGAQAAILYLVFFRDVLTPKETE